MDRNDDWLKSLNELAIHSFDFSLSTGYEFSLFKPDKKTKYEKLFIKPPGATTYYKVGIITNSNLFKEAFKTNE